MNPGCSKPRPTGIALIVGDGFSRDYSRHMKLMPGLELGKPLSWSVRVPGQPELTIREALPHFWKAVDAYRLANPHDSEWDLLRQVMGVEGSRDCKVEVEARHFLVYAYRGYSLDIIREFRQEWRWFQWLKVYAPCIAACISFNYDIVLEYALQLIGQPMTLWDYYEPGMTFLFKPHGSVDYDVTFREFGRNSFPLRIHSILSNAPAHVIDWADWDRAPKEALAVLPYEENPYINLQWVLPGFGRYTQISPSITDLVIVGLSYHKADRKEIDHFLERTKKSCNVIVANPNPPNELIEAIKRSGRPLYLWKDGPENLPGISGERGD